MPQTARAATRVESVGSYTTILFGCAGGSGTSTIVTLPGGQVVLNVLVGGATSATAPFCATVSGNQFTVTHANNDLFTYIALVKGGV
jgi:hypothetical protein